MGFDLGTHKTIFSLTVMGERRYNNTVDLNRIFEGESSMSQRLKKIALIGIVLAAIAALVYALLRKFRNKTA